MTSATRSSPPVGTSLDAFPWRNSVEVVGRVAAAGDIRVLATGEEVAGVRLMVPRVPEPETGQRIDTLDLIAKTSRLRARLLKLPPGAVVEVRGAVRHRFFRTASGAVSRWEIEVLSLTRLDGRGGQPRAGRSA